MPIYEYRCSTCEYEAEEYQRMSDPVLTVCPSCERKTYLKQVSLCHTDAKPFQTPISMYSVAVENVNEIRRLQKECPDAKISDDPRDPLFGVPVAPDRRAKKQVLKASGFIERN